MQTMGSAPARNAQMNSGPMPPPQMPAPQAAAACAPCKTPAGMVGGVKQGMVAV